MKITLLALFLSVSVAIAGNPILQNSYDTNRDSVVNLFVQTNANNSASNFVANLLGFNNGTLNGGSKNFFIGNAGTTSVTGSQNVGIGDSALSLSIGGLFNTSVGVNSLLNNVSGSANTAFGNQALQTATVGAYNTAIGYQALISATSSSNVVVGQESGSSLTTGGFNIDIGNTGVSTDTNIIRIGDVQSDTFLTGTTHVGVVYANGQGITNVPKIFTVTNTTPTDTTSLAQAVIWLVITNNGTAYRVPAF